MSKATEILSLKQDAAVAWYADQSNTSCRIFNSGPEITNHGMITYVEKTKNTVMKEKNNKKNLCKFSL